MTKSKLFFAISIMSIPSFMVAMQQEENGEAAEVQIINAHSGVVFGAVYYKIHGYPYCKRGCRESSSLPSHECSEAALYPHNRYDSDGTVFVTLHDKNWKLLAHGEFSYESLESDVSYIKKTFLDPDEKPLAVKAVISEDLIYGRHIMFYDRVGVVVCGDRYYGSSDLTAEERAEFQDRLDLSNLGPVEVREAAFLVKVGKRLLNWLS
ncbi:MAG: hypothetical protein WCW33_04495 [Candidatus Babeliales bacterium]|jgi:hypothetical protein